MTELSSPLVLTREDRLRIERVEQLAGAPTPEVASLLPLLSDRSWAVRRAVVAALAAAGDVAVGGLAEVLRAGRDSETRIAAAVDALAASRGDVESAMLALIRGAVAAPILCDAAQVLGRRRSENGVAALEGLTRHPDDNVAVAAVEALGRIGASAGLDALIAILGSGNFFRTFPAVDVLGRSRDSRAIPPLIGLLDDPLFAVEAARALGRMGALAGVPPLASLLRRANDALARATAVALCAIHGHAVTYLGSGEPVELALRSAIDPFPVVQRLAQAVASASAEEQEALCSVLAWMRDPAAAATLISLLDVIPGAAGSAGRALGRARDPPRLEALRVGGSSRRALLLPLVGARSRSGAEAMVCLQDDDPAVRVLACNALARIGDTSAVPALFRLLGDPDPMLAQAAIGAIQSLGSEETERLALAAARSADPRERRAALRIVAYFGYAKGLDVLLDAARGEDDRLRDAALFGLPFIEDERAIEALLAAAVHRSPRARASAMRALGQAASGERVLERLRAGLSDPDAWVRYYACQSCGRLGAESVAPLIVELMHDPAGQVRVAAVEALAHIGVPAALEGLRRAAHSGDSDVQRAALVGLGIQRRKEAVPTLIAGTAAADAATRLIAVSSLAECEGAEVVPALAGAAADPDEAVRTAAIAGLGRRAEPAAVHALVSLLSQSTERARVIGALAFAAAGRIGGITAALESAGRDVAEGLIAALVRMNRPDATAALIEVLGGAAVEARRAAAVALGGVSSKEAQAALATAARKDPDAEVRRASHAASGR
ncbi:MAG: hypothetical protein NVSMB23_22320 [Myxococcales bacterium]